MLRKSIKMKILQWIKSRWLGRQGLTHNDLNDNNYRHWWHHHHHHHHHHNWAVGRVWPQASNHNPALLPFSRPCSRYNFIAFYFTLDLLQNATYFSHYTAAKQIFIVLGLQNAIKCYKAFATTTLYFIWCSCYKMLHSWSRSRWHCSVFIFWFVFVFKLHLNSC